MSTATKIVARILLPFFILNPIASYLMRKNISKNAQPETKPEIRHEITFTMYDYDEPMQIHKKAHSNYLAENLINKSSRYQGKLELSRPNPVELAWTVECEDELDIEEYTVYFSDNRNMKNAATYVTEEDVLSIYNVEIGATYYWYVSFECDGCEYKSEVSSFETNPEAPRNLYVDGVTNVRDMGGWDCDGGKVKQGMIFRTAKLHDDDEVNITEKGVAQILGDLKVKTEVDLRYEVTPTEYGSLGESVKYVVLPLDFSDDMMLDKTQAGYIRQFFGVLGDKNNYPVFFHCAIGTDRTGLCAFLLNGLLGVSEDDLYRDYRFSNFGFIGGERDGHNITHYIELLDGFEGEKLKDRIESYLLSIGVTAEDIKTIRTLMIEKN